MRRLPASIEPRRRSALSGWVEETIRGSGLACRAPALHAGTTWDIAVVDDDGRPRLVVLVGGDDGGLADLPSPLPASASAPAGREPPGPLRWLVARRDDATDATELALRDAFDRITLVEPRESPSLLVGRIATALTELAR